MINKHLRDRYSRQVMFPRIGEEGQARLLGGRAVIVGCGALGSQIAALLVRAGVGSIRIIDRDFVEYHNLQRQTLFDEEDVKERLPKALAAERHLKKVNSSVEIEGIAADANHSNIERFVSGADVILDGLDNPETRLLLNEVSLKHKIPWVYGGAIGSAGMTMTILPGETPCFQCAFPLDFDMAGFPTCETAGILGSAPAVVGALQAVEAIKILAGAADVNRGLIVADVWQGTLQRFRTERRAGCQPCQGKYQYLGQKPAIKTTLLCGQSRSVQVVNTAIDGIDLDRVAARLGGGFSPIRDGHMLRFTADDHEICAFPDGRAIVRNTVDEPLAKELYLRYIHE